MEDNEVSEEAIEAMALGVFKECTFLEVKTAMADPRTNLTPLEVKIMDKAVILFRKYQAMLNSKDGELTHEV